MSESLPSTPLDAPAGALLAAFERVQERRDDGELNVVGRRPPKEMLEEDVAITFPFSLYGEEFTILAWASPTNHHGSKRVRVQAYAPDVDVHSLDAKAPDTDYLAYHNMRDGDIRDEDVQDDVPHLLATSLGYITRHLLTGRDHRFSTSTHEEPAIDSI